jgi:chromate transporter
MRKLLWDLFASFFKIGPSSFGGGYAMIPSIEREVVGRRHWIEEEDMGDIVSIAGSAPGGIGVNAAAFIGYRLAGIRGAFVAVLGITLPTFLIVFGLCLSLAALGEQPKIAAAFEGIRAAIVALILLAGYKIGRTAVFDKTTLVIVVMTVLVLLFSTIHPILIIITGLGLGIIFVKIKEGMGLVVRLNKGSTNESTIGTTKPYSHSFADYYFGEGI